MRIIEPNTHRSRAVVWQAAPRLFGRHIEGLPDTMPPDYRGRDVKSGH